MDPSHTRLGADTGRPDGILRGQNATETLGLNPDSGLYTKYYALSNLNPFMDKTRQPSWIFREPLVFPDILDLPL